MDETKVQIGEEVLLDIGIHSEWYISSTGYDGESVDITLRKKADRIQKWWLSEELLPDGKPCALTLQSSDGNAVDLVPAPKWIPCRDRLPESDYMCLVSCKTKKGIKSVNRAYYSDGLWHGSGSMSGVEAWMPLPEPYTADTPQTDRMTEEEIDTILAKALVGQTDCSWMRYEE